ncbi:MAG: hypothetical protein DA408_09230 [Bacteroidetes bacterium]|nr:MAG: hypothetical protein C7N36_01885 [Bacteroidota bacterium]PTM12779.1 MAG: hypothetical protein DA408_09230 [Bacteroidota bacterium]
MPKTTPHDDLFKATFSIVSEVESFLRSYLPTWLANSLDYTTLQQATTSYVSESLHQYFSDIVYSCQWRAADSANGEVVQIALLLEHKSYQPQNIYIQLLRYLTETYQHQHQKGEELQLVIPIVVYHGQERWRQRSFADYFKLPDEQLLPYLPGFEYELVDLNKVSNKLIIEQQKGYFLKSTFLLFKLGKEVKSPEQLSEEIFIFVREVLDPDQKLTFLRQLVTYIFQAFKFQKEEFIQYTKKLPIMTQTVANSLYDSLLQEGMEKGIEQGMEKGIEQGIEQGQLINTVEEHFNLLEKMTQKQLEPEWIQEFLDLPISFIEAFRVAYTPASIAQFDLEVQAARHLRGVVATRAHLALALQNYGITKEDALAYMGLTAEE